MKLILLSRSEVAEVHNVLAVPTEECCRWMRATGLLHSESPGGEGRRSRGRRRAVLRAGGEGAAERRHGDRNWVTAWRGCGQKVREMRLRPLKDSEEQDMPLVCACNVCVFWGGKGCVHARMPAHMQAPVPPAPTRRIGPWHSSQMNKRPCHGDQAAHPAEGLPRGPLSTYPSPWNPRNSKSRFHLTHESVKYNLNCHKAIYGLYFSHLLWIFIHFAAEILMCLRTECCSGHTGVIINAVECGPNHPSKIWKVMNFETCGPKGFR